LPAALSTGTQSHDPLPFLSAPRLRGPQSCPRTPSRAARRASWWWCPAPAPRPTPPPPTPSPQVWPVAPLSLCPPAASPEGAGHTASPTDAGGGGGGCDDLLGAMGAMMASPPTSPGVAGGGGGASTPCGAWVRAGRLPTNSGGWSFLVADVGRPHQPIVYCSPAFAALTGYAPAEALGRGCAFLQGPAPGGSSIPPQFCRKSRGEGQGGGGGRWLLCACPTVHPKRAQSPLSRQSFAGIALGGMGEGVACSHVMYTRVPSTSIKPNATIGTNAFVGCCFVSMLLSFAGFAGY